MLTKEDIALLDRMVAGELALGDLVPLLAHTSLHVRAEAACQIARQADEGDDIPGLRAAITLLLDDPSPAVRRAAQVALDTMTAGDGAP